MLCKIIPEKCIACGLCQVYAPKIFDYDNNGIVILKNDPLNLKEVIALPEQAHVLSAYRKCPVRATEIENHLNI